VRRPTVSPQSPTLGLTHLQFEAMRIATSARSCSTATAPARTDVAGHRSYIRAAYTSSGT
jgi:hypothetical protein